MRATGCHHVLVVTLPKVTSTEQVAVLCELLDLLE